MSQPRRVPVDITRVEEPWAIAYLADGIQVKVRIIFTQVALLVGENGEPVLE